MGQPSFLGLSRRYEGLDAKKDPLVAILAAVPFELFRPKLKAAQVAGGLRTANAQRQCAAGRRPWDEVLIFKYVLSLSKGCWCCRRCTIWRMIRPSISRATGFHSYALPGSG